MCVYLRANFEVSSIVVTRGKTRPNQGYVIRQLMRQLRYSSLLLIIRLRFTCGERKNWKKRKKFSKQYDHGCLKNFLSHFMSFLTVPVSKEVIYFCWTLLYLSETMSSTKLEGIAKPSLDHGDRKSSYHVRQITTNFCNLVALNLI